MLLTLVTLLFTARVTSMPDITVMRTIREEDLGWVVNLKMSKSFFGERDCDHLTRLVLPPFDWPGNRGSHDLRRPSGFPEDIWQDLQPVESWARVNPSMRYGQRPIEVKIYDTLYIGNVSVFHCSEGMGLIRAIQGNGDYFFLNCPITFSFNLDGSYSGISILKTAFVPGPSVHYWLPDFFSAIRIKVTHLQRK